MEGDSLRTIGDRLADVLYAQLQAAMPRPGANHPYSGGAMLYGFVQNGLTLEMSQGVPYSHYAMGYRDDGSKRVPRGKAETLNFKTIESCIRSSANIIISLVGGKVIYD